MQDNRVARNQKMDKWLADVIPRHRSLTTTVISITESLLKANNIDYLTVTGRTKGVEEIKEKIKRKSYKQPKKQLTDISGIRIIVYFEADVQKASNVIESSFCVDRANSLDKQALLAADQTGYRSVHYVCDIGKERSSLPEFNGLGGLKFEFQIRTVLQHAWAELAHDRNYKFSGKLPREIERNLYLYAGMLEIVDKGFDELSQRIDRYVEDLKSKTRKGRLDIEINSLSLEEFIHQWAAKTGFRLEEPPDKDGYGDLISELNQFGIYSLSDLSSIIPEDYSRKAAKFDYASNIYGLVRDWMLIKDFRKFAAVKREWSLGPEAGILPQYFGKKKLAELYDLFDYDPSIPWELVDKDY